jgi:hypothetical protein
MGRGLSAALIKMIHEINLKSKIIVSLKSKQRTSKILLILSHGQYISKNIIYRKESEKFPRFLLGNIALQIFSCMNTLYLFVHFLCKPQKLSELLNFLER